MKIIWYLVLGITSTAGETLSLGTTSTDILVDGDGLTYNDIDKEHTTNGEKVVKVWGATPTNLYRGLVPRLQV